MIYTEKFLEEQKKSTDKLIKFLQECAYSGSFETKLDLNVVIKTLANQNIIIDYLKKELNTKTEDLEKLKGDLKK
jgi:hypothetical protein